MRADKYKSLGDDLGMPDFSTSSSNLEDKDKDRDSKEREKEREPLLWSGDVLRLTQVCPPPPHPTHTPSCLHEGWNNIEVNEIELSTIRYDTIDVLESVNVMYVRMDLIRAYERKSDQPQHSTPLLDFLS